MKLKQYLNEETTGLDDILTSASEYGVTFKTGKPVTFNYGRFTKSGASKIKGGFQQNLEPSGMYMTHDFRPDIPMEGQEKGVMKFKKPLVIKFNAAGEILEYDENSWKAKLVQIFKKKKKALSSKLKSLGYDGIVTVDGKYTMEIIKL